MAKVKSNAYGQGIERIATALTDADALGVAWSEEGLILRQAGVKNPIVLMEGLFSPDELTRAMTNDFILVVHHVSQVEMLEKHADMQPFSIWLKIDTGMHRLGFEPNDVEKIYLRLQNCPAVKTPIGLMTLFDELD